MRFCYLFLFLLLAAHASAQIKQPEPPAVKIPFAESKQAVVVTTPSWTATQGTARLFERRSSRSRWTIGIGDDVLCKKTSDRAFDFHALHSECAGFAFDDFESCINRNHMERGGAVQIAAADKMSAVQIV